MSQKIENIKVKDLVLWTENPRDPISSSASDSDVIARAVNDPRNKWDLNKLAREMGPYYDMSELPIVVYKNGKPIVYDGNRRVVLAKIKLGFVIADNLTCELPDVPSELPCNVCSEDVALSSVYRKHVKLRNSWDALERDIFANKYLKEPKSAFLKFDEGTGGFISKNPEMNQGFVRKEVLTENLLSQMGFEFDGDKLFTRHTDEEVRVLLDNVLEKIKAKEIWTRGEYRGKPLDVLDQRVKDIINSNKNRELRVYTPASEKKGDPTEKKSKDEDHTRKTRITKPSKIEYFGEKLILKPGDVNNLYSDILALSNVIRGGKVVFSSCAYGLLRMSLRLLCETASKELGYSDIKEYINKYYPAAKKTLSQDIRTFLSSNNVTGDSLTQLMHTGAHNYISSTSADQALCISIILGAMLKISHGRSK